MQTRPWAIVLAGIVVLGLVVLLLVQFLGDGNTPGPVRSPVDDQLTSNRQQRAAQSESKLQQISARIEAATEAELDDMLAGDDFELALAAAWRQYCENGVDLPPEDRTEDTPALRAFAEEIGLRTNAIVPTSWVRIIGSARRLDNDLDSVVFTFANEEEDRALARQPFLEWKADHWQLNYPKVEFLELEASRDEFVGVNDMSYIFGTEAVFIAVDSLTQPVRWLYAFNPQTGAFQWKVEVFAESGGGNSTGQRLCYVDLELTDRTVVLFAIEPGLATVQVFDRETGKKLHDFSTFYVPMRAQ